MAGLALRRRVRPAALISVVPMIDVLMILLIFFMVTSTYLNLNMVPAVQADDPTQAAAEPPPDDAEPVPTLLIRLGADGMAVIGGQRLDLDGLQAVVAARITAAPDTPVVVLPSGAADTQALISLMDRIAQGGAARVRIVRIEAGP